MIAKRTVNVPRWLAENEILAMSLSHATTKYEYYASRERVFSAKYGCDFKSFKQRVESAKEESFTEWDDLIAWEALDAASREWKSRYEELRACLKRQVGAVLF